jgi:hypothetical protein
MPSPANSRKKMSCLQIVALRNSVTSITRGVHFFAFLTIFDRDFQASLFKGKELAGKSARKKISRPPHHLEGGRNRCCNHCALAREIICTVQ